MAQIFGAQGFFGDDEAMSVVVDVGEADPIGAWTEYAQASGASGFEDVGQEQVVARAVAAERRGGMREAREKGMKVRSRTLGVGLQRRS